LGNQGNLGKGGRSRPSSLSKHQGRKEVQGKIRRLSIHWGKRDSKGQDNGKRGNFKRKGVEKELSMGVAEMLEDMSWRRLL